MASAEEYAEGMGIEPATVFGRAGEEVEDDEEDEEEGEDFLASGDDSRPAVRRGCGRLER
jgi:hypothetical protein